MSDVILYHHRGDVTPITKVMSWWRDMKFQGVLIIRLDEDDPHLPTISEYFAQTKVPANWNVVMGDRLDDALDLTAEMSRYASLQVCRDLALVTSDVHSIGLFLLKYALNSKDEGGEVKQ